MHVRIRDKQSARKATTAAQAAAVVLFASGAAMAMLGPRLLEVEEPEAPAVVPGDEAEGPEPTIAEAPPLDVGTTTQNYLLLGNTPVPDPIAADEPDPEPEAAPSGRTIRYVGAVRSGGRLAAFLNIDGVTKLLRTGGAPYEGVQLVAVDTDEIVVSVNGGDELTVQKGERQGPPVTVVVGGAPPVEPVVSADDADSPRFSPDMTREERREALMERARAERSRWQREREERGEEFTPPDRIEN
jgi:hypothetical protein